MNVLSITIESDFTLCWSKCCGYYEYRYATSSPTRFARAKIITKKDRWLGASRCFTMLLAPPDPGSVHLHSSHRRVLGSSPKSPGRRQGQGQVSLSLFLWLTRTFFWGQNWQTLSDETQHIYALSHSGSQNYSNIRHSEFVSLILK